MAHDRPIETGTPSAANGYFNNDGGNRTRTTRLAEFIALGLVFYTLAACTPMQARPTTQSDPAPPMTIQNASELDNALEYYARIWQLSGAALSKAQDAQRQTYARDKSDLARVQLALALSVPNNTDGDNARVVTLLDPLAKNAGPGSAPLRNLALLLSDLVSDNRKLNDSVVTLKQKLKEGQKETNALEQKLDALKSLEKRPSKAPRPEQ
jgi:hypothetical protein